MHPSNRIARFFAVMIATSPYLNTAHSDIVVLASVLVQVNEATSTPCLGRALKNLLAYLQ